MQIPPKVSDQQILQQASTLKSDHTAGAAQIKNWQVGQVLNATVVTQVSANVFSVSINKAVYNAQTDLLLQSGQKIMVEVARTGQSTLLKLLPPQVQINENEAIVQNAMKKSLPQQSGLSSLVANINELAKLSNSPKFPEQLLKLTQQIMAQISDIKDVKNPENLKQALNNSGLFLENKLVKALTTNNPALLNGDFKAVLNQFLSTLKQTQISNELIIEKPVVTDNLKQIAEKIFNQLPNNIKNAHPDQLKTLLLDTAKFMDNQLQRFSFVTAANPQHQPILKQDLFTLLTGLSYTQIPEENDLHSKLEQQTKFLAQINQLGKQLAQHLNALLKNGIPENLKSALKETASFMENRLNQIYGNNIPPKLVAELKSSLFRSLQTRAKAAASAGSTSSLRPPTKGAALQSQAAQKPNIQVSQFSQTINKLLQQTQGALARIQLSQLATLPDEEGRDKTVWTHELPIKNGEDIDIIQIRFEHESSINHAIEDNWNVSLAFDFEKTGPMYTRMFMANGELSTIFWAENLKTVEMVNNKIPLLQQFLEQSGLTIKHLLCRHGIPPNTQPAQEKPQTPILDIQT